MNGNWPLILVLLMLGVMMWSSFVWRRKFLEAEKESQRHSVRVSQLEVANYKQQEILREMKQDAHSRKAENRRLKDYVRVLERSRVKTDDRQVWYGKIYGVPNQPAKSPRLGVVEFDSKAGRWTITYPD
jgi:hypothetical protein|uniref:Uncharacterized protein n=1 Tax=Myoviridae sp. ctshb19 TaxID=2825194 RepID=A0A8S5UGP9_9CAUD|nr:MAG TPA: hypothetical protein [Myoviridae sp. ctshb19]